MNISPGLTSILRGTFGLLSQEPGECPIHPVVVADSTGEPRPGAEGSLHRVSIVNATLLADDLHQVRVPQIEGDGAGHVAVVGGRIQYQHLRYRVLTIEARGDGGEVVTHSLDRGAALLLVHRTTFPSVASSLTKGSRWPLNT